MMSDLTHFGVKGMRWGHRKKEEVANKKLAKSEKKARMFEAKAETAETYKRRQMYLREAQRAREGKLSRRQRQIIVGAAFVAAYATYKFVDSGEARQRTEQGKAFVDKVFNQGRQKKAGNVLGQSGFWKRKESLAASDLSPDELYDSIVKKINPDYGKFGSTMNCRRCTLAYELSRRGFDVEATKTRSGTGQAAGGLYNTMSGHKKVHTKYLVPNLYSLFADKKFNEYVTNDGSMDIRALDAAERTSEIFKAFKTMPHGARGELMVNWTVGSGHSMVWEITKNGPVIFDAQTNNMYKSEEALGDIAKYIGKFTTTRLDDVELDYNYLRRWVKDA